MKKALVISFQSLTQKSAGGIGKLGFYLSKSLDESNKLNKFVVSSKGKFKTSFPSEPVSRLSRYYLFLINKVEKKNHLKSHVSRYIQECLFDWFCQFHIKESTELIITTTPYLYKTFRKAKRLCIPIYFIPGNPEDNLINEIVTQEKKKFNIQLSDAYTYPKRLNFYNKSVSLIDHIITYSSVMEESYASKNEFNVIPINGYLKPDFDLPYRQISCRENETFKVAFLAHTVLLKGLQYLLEAWSDLQHLEMELHIGGAIDNNIRKIIQERFKDLRNVYYYGKIEDVANFLHDKSLYILPSLIDGAPVTVLEAIYCNIPVIVTEKCGTKDILENGKTGWVIKPGNSQEIKDKITWIFENKTASQLMALKAKMILDNYNIATFINGIDNVIDWKNKYE